MKYFFIILFFASCSPRTGFYKVISAEIKGMHETVYVQGLQYPIELPSCTCYKKDSMIFLDFSYRKSLFK